jgi:ketosteroid isomerase-like protein
MGRQQGRTSPAEEHPNAAVARGIWLATSEGDADALRRLLAPDIVWRILSMGALSGAAEGADGVIDLFARSGELVDALTSELIDIYSSADGAVVHYRLRAARDARHLDTEVLVVLRIRAGRASEALSVPVRQKESEAFWRSH